MGQLYQTRTGLARCARIGFRRTLGGVPRAVLLRSLGRGPILLAKQNYRIGPFIGTPYVPLLVGLEEGEIVSRDLAVIEFGRPGEMVAVVPLPLCGMGRGEIRSPWGGRHVRRGRMSVLHFG